MNQGEIFWGKQNILLNKDKGSAIENLICTIIIIALIFTGFNNFSIFHIFCEVCISVITFGTLMVAANTYKISKNDFFMFLGIGYVFTGTLDWMHAFSYSQFDIFPNASINMVEQLSIGARLVEMITLLISPVFVYKKIKEPNFTLILLLYLGVFTFITLSIVYFKVFPESRIDEFTVTKFKLVIGYTVSLGICVAAWIFYKARKFVDKSLFSQFQASIIASGLCMILFTLNNNFTGFTAVVGHIIKVMSFYFLYRAVIVNGIQRPFDKLIFQLDKSDINLKEEEKQRRLMEETIAKNEQCYDLIINNSRDAIIIKSEGKVVFANSAAASILGAKASFEIVGRELSEFIQTDYFRRENIYIKKSNENKNGLPFNEFELVRLDGKRIFIESSGVSILYRGKPAVLSMFRDISSRKKIERLEVSIKENEEKLNRSEEFNRVLTEFFTNISHELKTPLNVIISAIQLLNLSANKIKSNSLNEKLNKLTDVMMQNSYRLLRLVNNLIDISKIDAGYLKLQLRNYNIVSVVEDISLSVVDYGESKNISIVFDTDTEEKEMAIDADKIERIMLNLLSNAIKFTNEGDKIIVTILDKNERILISVKDTGVGIPEDKVDIIFDRFGQVDKTLKRNREGSGVGLALVKNLVEMHDGTIEVKSKIGEGSEFIIELPVKLADEETIDDAFLYSSNVEKINIEFSDIYSY